MISWNGMFKILNLSLFVKDTVVAPINYMYVHHHSAEAITLACVDFVNN